CGTSGGILKLPEAVEMDVHATFDNEVVVLHDTTAARVAAAGSPFADEPVAGLRLEQVRRIRLRNGEGVPTLAEVAGAVVALQSFFQQHPGVLERVLLICFHDLVLVELAARIADYRLGVLRGKGNSTDLQVLDRILLANLAAFLPDVTALDPTVISWARGRGAQTGCWIVRDSTDLGRAWRRE
ncbi:glycerophosphodiester phosphodiesterase, partial [Corynebacterium hylobatis]